MQEECLGQQTDDNGSERIENMSFKNASTKTLKKEIKKLRLELHQHKVYKSGIFGSLQGNYYYGFQRMEAKVL